MSAENAFAGDREVQAAHALIGGFIVRCSALEYRASQMIARWFCNGQKQKYLSYVLHGMSFPQMRQIIEERLTSYHPNPDAIRGAMAEIQPIIERRDLVASGLLSKAYDGSGYLVKSHSGLRYISGADEQDIIAVESLEHWSQQATRLAERLVRLGDELQDKAS